MDAEIMIPIIPDPKFVLALRYAALRMLLETEDRPKRIIVDLDLLIGEALQIYHGGMPPK